MPRIPFCQDSSMTFFPVLQLFDHISSKEEKEDKKAASTSRDVRKVSQGISAHSFSASEFPWWPSGASQRRVWKKKITFSPKFRFPDFTGTKTCIEYCLKILKFWSLMIGHKKRIRILMVRFFVRFLWKRSKKINFWRKQILPHLMILCLLSESNIFQTTYVLTYVHRCVSIPEWEKERNSDCQLEKSS